MDGARDFAEIQPESLRFFHNAFSVLSDLLYMPSGLMAVQALIVMVCVLEYLSIQSLTKYPDFLRRAFRKSGRRVHALCFCRSACTIKRTSPTAIKGMEPSKGGHVTQKLGLFGRILLRQESCVAIGPAIGKDHAPVPVPFFRLIRFSPFLTRRPRPWMMMKLAARYPTRFLMEARRILKWPLLL